MTGISVNPLFAVKFINEAMDILSTKYDTACIRDSADVITTKDYEELEVPFGCVAIKRIEKDGYKYNDYTADKDYMTIRDKGAYTVKFNRKPQEVSSGGETPEINSSYHSIIVFYVAFCIGKNPVNEEKFYALAEDVNNRLKRVKRSGNKIPAPIWR